MAQTCLLFINPPKMQFSRYLLYMSLLLHGANFAISKGPLISGGILYEKLSSRPITVNPFTIKFYRHLNTTLITKSVDFGSRYLKQYQILCSRLHRRVALSNRKVSGRTGIFPLRGAKYVMDAGRHCSENSGRLPEIRTLDQFFRLQAVMNLFKVKMVRAGIKLGDSSKFVFMSDSHDISEKLFKDIFPYVIVGNRESHAFHEDQAAEADAKSGFVFVYQLKSNSVELALVDPKKHLLDIDTIICQGMVNNVSAQAFESTMLTKVNAHSCVNNVNTYFNVHNAFVRELKLFLSPAWDTKLEASQLTVNQSLFNMSNFQQIARPPLLDKKKICEPHFLEECEIDFMNWLDRVYLISRTLATKAEINFSLMRIYILHLITENASKPVDESSPVADCEPEFTSFKKPTRFETYLHKALYQLRDSCPEKISGPVLVQLNGFIYTSQYRQYFMELIKLSSAYLELKEKSPIDLPRSKRSARPKRFLPAGSTTLYGYRDYLLSSITPPHSWVEDIIGNMSLFSQTEHTVRFENIKQTMTPISNLTINQHVLEINFNSLAKDFDRVMHASSAVDLSTASLLSESDTNLLLRDFYGSLRDTLLKISQVLSDISIKKTSPQALSKAELKYLSSIYRDRDILLSSDFDDVIMALNVDRHNIVFLYEVPTKADRSLFHIYSAKPLPLNYDHERILPVVDIKYFGISVKNNEYTVLAESEVDSCLRDRFCLVNDVLRKIDDTQHCALKSFYKNVLTCDVIFTKDPKGFYELHGRHLIYSVPKPEQLTLICNNNSQDETVHSLVTVSGIGIAYLAPDCQVILPNKRRLFSTTNPFLENLRTGHLLNTFNRSPNFGNLTLKPNNHSIYNHTFIDNSYSYETESGINSVQQWVEITFSVRDFLPEFSRVIIGMILVAIIFGLTCLCSPTVRTWFKTFILWKNPFTWFTEFRRIDLSTWTRQGTKYEKATREIVENGKVLEKVLGKTISKPNQAAC